MRTIHIYRDDGTRDAEGRGRCLDCGTPISNDRHDLPDRTNEMAAHWRRIGEADPAPASAS